jgi:methyl-accepting chemotaxis protein
MNSISKKVLVGYLLVLLVTIIASVTLFGAASVVNHRTDEFIGQTLPQLSDVQEVQQSLDTIQIAAYGLYGTMIDVADFDKVIKKNQETLNQRLTRSNITSSDNSQVVGSQSKKLFTIMAKLQQIMAAEEVDWDAAREILAEVDSQSKKISSTLLKIKESISHDANMSSKVIRAEISDIQWLVVILLISIIIVAIIAYALTHKKVTRPIRELATELDVVAKNYDLTVVVAEQSKDEIGVAAQSVNRLLSTFKDGINDVRNIANNINLLVCELGQSSQTADEQVALLNEKIESLLNEMLQLEQQITQGFHQSNSASEKAKQGAEEVKEGADQVSKTSTGIAALAQDIEASSEMLLELRKSGDKVSTVVGTIAEIADQTNLLALNAAIEAARAGESGRGFAVVADEVRTLATRTHQSTIEINAMLATIVSSISQVVSSMEKNQIQANQAVELSQKTVGSLSLIQSTILALSNESSEAAQQAESSHHQVVTMRSWLDQFKTVGDAVCQGSMETRETSLKMTELAASFNQSVEKFRTK